MSADVFILPQPLPFAIPVAYGTAGTTGAKGDPGANVMAIGLFTAASGLLIPVGTNVVRTSGHSADGVGIGDYVYDAAVDAAYVTANPDVSFVTANSRGFRLSLDQFFNVHMFGAAADYSGGTGTDLLAALTAAWTYLGAHATAGFINDTIYRGSFSLHVPAGRYYCSGAIEPLISLILYGDGGKSWSAATQIYFPSAVTALRSQSFNTSGSTTIDGTNHFSGDQLVVQDIAFLAPGFDGSAVTEGEYHGCHAKRPVSLIRCTFAGFQGDGLYIDGSGTGGLADLGHVENCDFLHNRNGRFSTGSDSNAWKLFGNTYNDNRRWGGRDESFLSIYEAFSHASGNGIVTTTAPYSMVSYSGNRYSVREGQDIGASTNAPSGTTADNSWWLYDYAGGVTSATPAWFSGISLRSGGAYYMAGVNQTGMLHSCYSEGGQGPTQAFSPCMIVHGTLSSGFKGSASYIHASLGQTIIENGDSDAGLLVKGKVVAQFGTGTVTLDPFNEVVTFDGAGAPIIKLTVGGVLKSQLFTSGGDTFLESANGVLHARKLDGTHAIALSQQARPGAPALADVVSLLDALGLWA